LRDHLDRFFGLDVYRRFGATVSWDGDDNGTRV